MSQYANLDRAILSRLRREPMRLVVLNAQEVRAESERLAEASGREPFRVLDGRLAALKRSGKIAYSSKTGWSLAAAALAVPGDTQP